MKTLGIHYHIAVKSVDGKLLAPGYYSKFIDSIATEWDKVLLFAYVPLGEHEKNLCDTPFEATNIELKSLGPHYKVYKRFLVNKARSAILSSADEFDSFLFRLPTPIFVTLPMRFFLDNSVCGYLVGDYMEGWKSTIPSTVYRLKHLLLYVYYSAYSRRQAKRLTVCTSIVTNSAFLQERLQANFKHQVHLVESTTLSNKDILKDEQHIKVKGIKRIFFAGRFDPQKGLYELFKAFEILKQDVSTDFELHLAGWFDSDDRELILAFERMKEGYPNSFFNHGKLKVGSELLEKMDQMDLFIIPSYAEGFPRVIWEAMARGVPVIASNVGAIPFYLRHNVDALIVEPKSSKDIVMAVTQLFNNSELYRTIVKNGLLKVKEITLEKKGKQLNKILLDE